MQYNHSKVHIFYFIYTLHHHVDIIASVRSPQLFVPINSRHQQKTVQLALCLEPAVEKAADVLRCVALDLLYIQWETKTVMLNLT